VGASTGSVGVSRVWVSATTEELGFADRWEIFLRHRWIVKLVLFDFCSESPISGVVIERERIPVAARRFRFRGEVRKALDLEQPKSHDHQELEGDRSALGAVEVSGHLV
jgi:hypothetical protein